MCWIVILTTALAAATGGTAPSAAEELHPTLFGEGVFSTAAYDFFVAKGLANFQSAGIVGNLDQESGVNPGSVQYGGGPGRGSREPISIISSRTCTRSRAAT